MLDFKLDNNLSIFKNLLKIKGIGVNKAQYICNQLGLSYERKNCYDSFNKNLYKESKSLLKTHGSSYSNIIKRGLPLLMLLNKGHEAFALHLSETLRARSQSVSTNFTGAAHLKTNEATPEGPTLTHVDALRSQASGSLKGRRDMQSIPRGKRSTAFWRHDNQKLPPILPLNIFNITTHSVNKQSKTLCDPEEFSTYSQKVFSKRSLQSHLLNPREHSTALCVKQNAKRPLCAQNPSGAKHTHTELPNRDTQLNAPSGGFADPREHIREICPKDTLGLTELSRIRLLSVFLPRNISETSASSRFNSDALYIQTSQFLSNLSNARDAGDRNTSGLSNSQLDQTLRSTQQTHKIAKHPQSVPSGHYSVFEYRTQIPTVLNIKRYVYNLNNKLDNLFQFLRSPEGADSLRSPLSKFTIIDTKHTQSAFCNTLQSFSRVGLLCPEGTLLGSSSDTLPRSVFQKFQSSFGTQHIFKPNQRLLLPFLLNGPRVLRTFNGPEGLTVLQNSLTSVVAPEGVSPGHMQSSLAPSGVTSRVSALHEAKSVTPLRDSLVCSSDTMRVFFKNPLNTPGFLSLKHLRNPEGCFAPLRSDSAELQTKKTRGYLMQNAMRLRTQRLLSDFTKNRGGQTSQGSRLIFGEKPLAQFELSRKLRLIDSNCYRGKRLKFGYPSRGQRTKSNAKTAKRLNAKRI